nr:MAG: hypothetical protein [Tombusviridae sp.]
MDMGILSADIYVGDVLIHQGLKERPTLMGQIVTALKMAMVVVVGVLLWPFRTVFAFVRGVWRIVRSWAQKIYKVCRLLGTSIQAVVTDTRDVLEVTLNRRVVALAYLMLPVFLVIVGFVGLLLWIFLIGAYCLCYVPRNLRDVITFRRKLASAWEEVLESDIKEDLPAASEEIVEVHKKKRNSFACKVATRAIAKVGLLKPTKANALVYQKVILDILKDMNVRYVDRLRVLPLAIAACLDRPEEVNLVEEVIDHLLTVPSGSA